MYKIALCWKDESRVIVENTHSKNLIKRIINHHFKNNNELVKVENAKNDWLKEMGIDFKIAVQVEVCIYCLKPSCVTQACINNRTLTHGSAQNSLTGKEQQMVECLEQAIDGGIGYDQIGHFLSKL